jgi:type II secretory pathway pseudopilin PulG
MTDVEGSSSTGLIVGIVVGVVVVVVLVLGGIAALLLVPATQQVRLAAARTQCTNNLKQIGLAMYAYHDEHKQLPPAVVYDQNGKALYSWRVLLLPYLEQENLYRQFNLTEPWDSPTNIKLLQQTPPVYLHPGAANADRALTFFQVFDGPADDKRPRAVFASKGSKRIPFKAAGLPPGPIALFQSDPVMKLTDMVDGSSNTILVAEAASGVPWTKPADLDYEPGQALLPKLGGQFPNHFLLLLGDASTRTIQAQAISEQTLRAAIAVDDGVVLGADW